MNLYNMHLREWVSKYFACGYILLPLMCLLVIIHPCLHGRICCCGFQHESGSDFCWNVELLVCVLSDLLGG
jgi:hypothetical protein